VAAKTNGEVYVWGYNSTGQLGLGDTTNRSSPVLLVGDWTKVVSAGNTGSIGNMYGIKSDGTLWGWGDNTKGQLGQGDTTDRSSPVQNSDFTDWTDIAANGEKWIGIRENGQAWGCGDGSSGQLDNYQTGNYSSPVQVAYTEAALIPACGYDHSLLLFTEVF
jgi:alpha-tubulin suppressor-like RCC1 family protein